MKSSKFYQHLFLLTLPIILQNLITTSINLLDTIMIGRLGEVPLAAVGIANQYYFIFTLFVFGIAGGSGVLIAQLYGKKDLDSINHVFMRSLNSGITFSIIFSLIGLASAEKIMGLFSSDPSIILIGSEYLRITIVSYLFTGISLLSASSLRSIKNTKLPMYASLIGLCINGSLNYILIFGKLGFSPMHTKGAAIATLIARLIECLILIIAISKTVPILNFNLLAFDKCSLEIQKNLRKMTLPILFNEACWGIGTVTYVALYANLGTQSAAAMQIASTIMNLFMVISFGLAYSSLVIVGNEIGASRNKEAMLASGKIRQLSVVIGLMISVLLFILAPYISSQFNVSTLVQNLSTNVLRVFALMFTLRTLNMVMIVGILRGGGDAAYGSILQGLTLWTIGIPLTYVVGYQLHLSLHYVVGISICEELVKLIFISRRYYSKKWIHNLTSKSETLKDFVLDC